MTGGHRSGHRSQQYPSADFQTRLPLQNRRLPVQRSSVTILGQHPGDHYRIKVCGILYHQYVDPRLKGALLRFKAYISRISHRVTLFIGLRGSFAADPTARMLYVLLATLAVWLAAALVFTIPFAPMSFPRIFNTVVLEASYATALVLLRLGHFRRASHLDLGDAYLLFLRRCT